MTGKEEFIKTLEETDTYRVDEVNLDYCEFWEKANYHMKKLVLKIDGKEISVRRYDFVGYEENILQTHIKHINLKRGYFCAYSKNVYGEGDPLDELLKGDLEDYTFIEENEDGLWRFLGNHRTYSGAFMYFLWNKDIVDKITKALPTNKAPSIEYSSNAIRY